MVYKTSTYLLGVVMLHQADDTLATLSDKTNILGLPLLSPFVHARTLSRVKHVTFEFLFFLKKICAHFFLKYKIRKECEKYYCIKTKTKTKTHIIHYLVRCVPKDLLVSCRWI